MQAEKFMLKTDLPVHELMTVKINQIDLLQYFRI